MRVSRLTIENPTANLLLTEDFLDCTGGAYPVSPERPSMRQQAWVFEPYFHARRTGKLARMDADGMRAIIDAVGDRITAQAEGRGREITLDTRYEEVGGGPGWRMIVEVGPHARTELFHSGIHAFVSVRENGDGTWSYTLGRMSPFVRFPVPELYVMLNRAEGLDEGLGWGGGNTIGGSPRQGGSRLSPPQLEELINEHIAATAK